MQTSESIIVPILEFENGKLIAKFGTNIIVIKIRQRSVRNVNLN